MLMAKICYVEGEYTDALGESPSGRQLYCNIKLSDWSEYLWLGVCVCRHTVGSSDVFTPVVGHYSTVNLDDMQLVGAPVYRLSMIAEAYATKGTHTHTHTRV